MNNGRRKQIECLSLALYGIKQEIDKLAADEEIGEAGTRDDLADREENWSSRIDDLKSDVESIKDDEQDYYDSMPEGLQGGDRGSMAEEAIQYLQKVEDHMEELIDCEEVGAFTKMFRDKYDDMESALQDAQA